MRRELILLLPTIRREHVFIEVGLDRSLGGGLSHLALGGHILPDALFYFLDLFGVGESGLDEGSLDQLDGVASGSGQCDLLTIAVGGTRIGHGVSMVTVGHHLHIHGPIARPDPLLHESHPLLNRQNVHPINPNSRNVISHLVVIRVGRMAILTRPHPVVVILNAEDHGKIPQTGHVGTLPNLSLIGRAVAVARDGHLHRLAGRGIVMVGKSKPKPDRDLRPHDALSAVEVALLVVKVHGPALALSGPPDVAEELGQDRGHRVPPRQCHAVTAVARDPRILGLERRIDAGGDGLLAIVEMAKSANRSRLVLVVARDLHTAHRVHQLEVLHEFILGHFDGVVGRRVEVVSFEGPR